MTKKSTRILGAALMLGALIALWSFFPSLYPTRASKSGLTIMRRPAIVRMAMSYLVAGMAAGFGLALLVWPFPAPAQQQGPKG